MVEYRKNEDGTVTVITTTSGYDKHGKYVDKVEEQTYDPKKPHCHRGNPKCLICGTWTGFDNSASQRPKSNPYRGRNPWSPSRKK